MEKVKDVLVRFSVKAKNGMYLAIKKLKDNKGSGIVEWLILVLAAVVVGAILLKLFGETIKSTWQTLQTRIADMFNYA